MTTNCIHRKLLLIGSLFSILLTGCNSTLVTPDFSVMSNKYSQLAEQYSINMNFANILRSAANRPLVFYDLPNIIGTGNINNSVGLNATLTNPASGYYGPNLWSGMINALYPSANTGFNNSFNFTQSSLDNSIFWEGFMKTIPLSSVKYFVDNQAPKEVLYSLVVNEIIVTQPDGTKKVLVNSPIFRTYPEFKNELYRLIQSGLTIQQSFSLIADGSPMNMADLKKLYGSDPANTLRYQRGMDLRKVGDNLYQVLRAIPVYELCMEQDQYANFVKKGKADKIYCQPPFQMSEETTHSKAKVEQKLKPSLVVTFRSTASIYTFLGQVLVAQNLENPLLVTLPPIESALIPVSAKPEKNRYALLVSNVDDSSGRPNFATVEALSDGKTYTIPMADSGYSTLTMHMLAVFQALAKSPNAIPASPAVLVK